MQQPKAPLPPKWLDKLLEWFCPDELLEEVQGDLQERYYRRLQKIGKRKASKLYFSDVVAYLSSFIFHRKQKNTPKPLYLAMLSNYLTIALRNLLRHKAFSFINISGLALGMACSILILLWVKDEISYDRFHQDADKLFYVYSVVNWGELSAARNTPGPLAEALAKEIPEVEYACRILQGNISELFTIGDKFYKETGGQYVSADFFNIFTFPLLEGDPNTALASPNSMVISETLAHKLFKNEKAIGQVIQTNGLGSFTVSAVMKDIPAHSSIKFDYALPLESFEKNQPWLKGWDNIGPLTIIKLKTASSEAAVARKIQHLPEQKKPGTPIKLFLQPFSEGYLYSGFENQKPSGGRIEYVQIFSLVGILILIIACINFMNLATARSARRSKEVGIRKVVGATRTSLMAQHIGEAVVMAFIALVFSLALVKLLLPTLNDFTQKNISLNLLEPVIVIGLLLLTLITGIISGSYPAFFLSGQKPVTVLKGNLKFNLSSLILRKGLVVFQFSLSILFIIACFVMYRQMDFIKNKNLGLDRENLISVSMEGDLMKKYELLKNELLKSTAISSVTQQANSPIESGMMGRMKWQGQSPEDNTQIEAIMVGYDYLKTVKVTLKYGRDFSKKFGEDAKSYVVNESVAKLMGKENPIGETIEFWNGPGKIIGVVKDYHSHSLHQPIGPQIFLFAPESTNQIIIRTEPGKTTTALQELEKAIIKYNPRFPFAYTFVDETFEKQYRSETIVGELAKYFAILAICICCLGLFGLAAFTAEQRTKEISIRKVLGASVTSLVALLSKDFVKLVIIAFVIATPVGLVIISKWLENFAYHIELSPWIFILAGLGALVVAIFTVGFQAIKAALANPVKTLRNE